MAKSFVMEASEREKVETMPLEDLKKFFKEDGFDEMREDIWHKEITGVEYEKNLIGVEATIEKLKKEKSIPTTTFKPFEDRLAVFADDVEVMTKGGLYKPNQVNQEKPSIGTVVAIGPKINGDIIKVGMKILYGKYAGTPITASMTDDREILIIRYADCFGER